VGWAVGGPRTAAVCALLVASSVAASVAALVSLGGCDRAAAEAIAVAGVAGAVQLAQLAAENAARDDRPPPPAPCGGYQQVECYTGPGLTLDEARDHTLAIINIVRSGSHLPPLNLDFALTAFAQDGAKQLARDHRPHAHIAGKPQLCPGCNEVQSDPGGFPAGAVEQQIDGILDGMISEGPGGPNHDVLVGDEWHRLGIGIVNPEGPLYLTIDVAP
jgi:hypothetical protein